MSIQFVCGDSGVGLSEHAYQYAVTQNAAWVSNNASAHISLLRATVREELAFVLEQQGIKAAEMASQVDEALQQWGLEPQAFQDPATLSSGQTRRLAIAAALLQRPQHLVLDCPCDGLDLASVAKLSVYVANFAGDVRIYDRYASPLADVADTTWLLSAAGELIPGEPQQRPLVSPVAREIGGEVLRAQQCSVIRGQARLQPQDFSVAAGSITHLAGPNGVGKTSLFRACLGLEDYQGLLKVPRTLGFAPTAMDESFLSRTVATELALGTDEERAGAMLEFAGLEAVAHLHPLDVPASTRRLVLLAAAMVTAPTLVLVDEPTVGLDAQGYAALADIMQRYVAGEFHDLIGTEVDATLGPAQLRYPKLRTELAATEEIAVVRPTIMFSCHDHNYAESFADVQIQLG
ncbi:MAG: ATP-binding cassette domain-containing protein [Corynebacterium sp.]|nr:ATP-binding cassette domain-containing protein [Corynebacterium sp.]